MENLLEVRNLKKYFPAKVDFWGRCQTYLRAVDGLSFNVKKGETLGIVGESGCGKSTAGRAVLRLHEPTGGEVYFAGENILKLDREAMRQKRKEMQFIFQDPFSSLNPRMTVGEIVGEPLLIHQKLTASERREKVGHLLELVGLNVYHARRYPHEFSGGQRQRIGIARAIALNPKLVIADEAVSALDVSIQAQIVNLFQELQEKLGLTYVFISHDLSITKHISNRIAVMYLGKFVEMADTDELFANPLHPYTKALLSAVPIPNPHNKRQRIILQGDVPSPLRPPAGCAFHTRCPYCMDISRIVKTFKVGNDLAAAKLGDNIPCPDNRFAVAGVCISFIIVKLPDPLLRIIFTQTYFLHYNMPFLLQFFRIKSRIKNHIHLHIKSGSQIFAWEKHIIMGIVITCGGIIHTADRVNNPVNFSCFLRCGSFKK